MGVHVIFLLEYARGVYVCVYLCVFVCAKMRFHDLRVYVCVCMYVCNHVGVL